MNTFHSWVQKEAQKSILFCGNYSFVKPRIFRRGRGFPGPRGAETMWFLCGVLSGGGEVCPAPAALKPCGFLIHIMSVLYAFSLLYSKAPSL
jgi:hypothetical protein